MRKVPSISGYDVFYNPSSPEFPTQWLYMNLINVLFLVFIIKLVVFLDDQHIIRSGRWCSVEKLYDHMHNLF